MSASQNPEIEKIIKAHFQESEIQFLIKWKGLENSHNCWLAQETLSNIAPALLCEYLKNKEIKQEEFFKEYECQKSENNQKSQSSCNYITGLRTLYNYYQIVKNKQQRNKESEIELINKAIKKIQKEEKGHSIVKKILFNDIIEDKDMCLVELEFANGETTKELMQTKEIKKKWLAKFIEFQSQKVAFLGKLKKEIEEEEEKY